MEHYSFMHRIRISMGAAWTLLITTFQVSFGLWKLSRLGGPAVTIFGGSRTKSPSPYLHEAQECARLLVEAGITVITGGGPGIMEAANCGAQRAADKKYQTIRIGIRDIPHERGLNACGSDTIMVKLFSARKWLLYTDSIGFIVFPGGFGTMDELSDLLNMIETGRISKRKIVLIGRAFWAPYLSWIEQACQDQLIERSNVQELISTTDDIHEAVSQIRSKSLSENSREPKIVNSRG